VWIDAALIHALHVRVAWAVAWTLAWTAARGLGDATSSEAAANLAVADALEHLAAMAAVLACGRVREVRDALAAMPQAATQSSGSQRSLSDMETGNGFLNGDCMLARDAQHAACIRCTQLTSHQC